MSRISIPTRCVISISKLAMNTMRVVGIDMPHTYKFNREMATYHGFPHAISAVSFGIRGNQSVEYMRNLPATCNMGFKYRPKWGVALKSKIVRRFGVWARYIQDTKPVARGDTRARAECRFYRSYRELVAVLRFIFIGRMVRPGI